MSLTYQSLPQFTRNPSYRVQTDWHYLQHTLGRWSEYTDCKLDLDPAFQRAHVWTPEQQSKYVEYILKGGQSGREIYFNCVGWQGSYKGPFVIVDGKQRLHAVLQFLDNKVPILGGYYATDIQGRIPTSAYFNFNVNDLPDMKLVLKWYLELNTGGTPHTAEEIKKVEDMLKSI